MRKIHLRPNTVINLGNTKTYCSRPIPYVEDTRGWVVDFGHFDATVHATLVTCQLCLSRIRGEGE